MITIIKKFKKSDGFTLFEITIVLAIIGIISAISVPIYQQIRPTLNLNSTTKDIISDLKYAQQLAVTEQDNYSIEFDIFFNKYTVTNTETGAIIKQKTINSDISIDSINGLTNDTLIFNVTGGVAEEGSLILINSKNITTTISIKPSGYVKIE